MTDAPVSLCDKCYAPGTCCRELTLTVNFWAEEEVTNQLLRERISNHPGNKNVPFEPVRQSVRVEHDKNGRAYGPWVWRCPKLLKNGRCGDYDNRPDVCRIFEPGENRLCVHFQGAEGVDLVEGL